MLKLIPDDVVAGWVRTLRSQADLLTGSGGSQRADRTPVAPVREGRGDFARRARGVVESRLDEPEFGVPELARALRLSPRQLQRRLQEETGQSPATFIRTIRLERARSLIEDGCHSVTDAAQAVRINSLSYFARCFRDEFGLNPSECGLGAARST